MEMGCGYWCRKCAMEIELWIQSSSWNSISRADTSASAVALWSSKQMFLSVRVLGLVAVAEGSSASCKEHKDGL